MRAEEYEVPAGNVIVGRRLAEDLHPVASPAFDPDDGSLFVTRSGARGEHLPVTLFRIDINGEISEFSGDMVNPTGIAFDSRGQMFVTSRMDGTVYRITPFKEAVPFARNLGVATGIAFDSADTMYVGDRTGRSTRLTVLAKRPSGPNWNHLFRLITWQLVLMRRCTLPVQRSPVLIRSCAWIAMGK